jgi:hypothetical protein
MTSSAWSSGDTDKVMRKFSGAREILLDFFEPGSPQEEFKIDEMAALGMRYNFCRAAEMDPRQSEVMHSSRRLRTVVDDEIYRLTQLNRYRNLIQQEFRRVVKSFYQMQAERLVTEAEIAKQTQCSATALATMGSGRNQVSNQGSVSVRDHGKRNLTPNSVSLLSTGSISPPCPGGAHRSQLLEPHVFFAVGAG